MAIEAVVTSADTIEEARKEAAAIEQEANEKAEQIFKEAQMKGFEEGRQKGYEEGLIELGLDGRNAQGGLNPVYHLPLTKKMYDALSGNKKLVGKMYRTERILRRSVSPEFKYPLES